MASLLALLFIYEDEVKAAVVRELNKHLKAEVKINPENIDLTIIKSFPDCSIQFKEVLMLEALPIKKRDTLLYAGQLNLFFNIKDLWNKNYQIKSVLLKDALLRPVILKNGKNNYTFWENADKSPKQKNDSINFNLNLLELENCHIQFKNKQQLFKTEFFIKSLDFKGHFSEVAYDMQSSGEILIKYITQQKTSFLKEKTLRYTAELAVNNTAYRFKHTEINLNRLGIELEGGFVFKDSLQNLDVNYKAPNLDIASLLSLLPNNFREKINDYNSEGNFYASGHLNYSGINQFSIESNFGIKNGQITYKPQSTQATNVNIEGQIKYSNAVSILELKNIYFKLNNDVLSGNCLVRNFSDPYLKLSTKASVNLQNLQSFWPIDTLTKLEGQLFLNADVEALISDLKSKTFSDKVRLNLDVGITNLQAQFKNDDKLYAVENCSLTAKEREIEVHDLKLKRGSSDIKVNGKMPGIFNYLSDRSNPLIIIGSLYSNAILLEDFMPASSKGGESNDNPLIPKNVDFKLNAAILKFNFGKFEATNITGDIEIKNQKAIVTEMKMDALEGSAEISAYADNSSGKLEVVLQSNLNNINIKTLFTQFNNFDQSTLIDNNLKGFATANIDFSGTWSNKLEVDYKSIRAGSDISIHKGELNDFKPLLSLSKYLGMADLQHIKFSSLTSSIEIKDKNIIIPKTAIKNSALDIDLKGTHSFDNYINYNIRLLNSDLKEKRKKSKEEEFGPVAKDLDNKRTLFIKMSGNIDDPKIEYDLKDMTQKIKEDFKEEKQNLRQLLKEEFGLFKKDSLKKKTKTQEQVFELEKPGATPKKPQDPKKEEEDGEDF
ncbi:MAG: AsmA-like C-terminal region-containing protein [Bacteroidia bacterium]|nr:AsmA-like C-terminal region-containing protein [Bacteroidia bacterium]